LFFPVKADNGIAGRLRLFEKDQSGFSGSGRFHANPDYDNFCRFHAFLFSKKYANWSVAGKDKLSRFCVLSTALPGRGKGREIFWPSFVWLE
jgi:hypothetical protein